MRGTSPGQGILGTRARGDPLYVESKKKSHKRTYKTERDSQIQRLCDLEKLMGTTFCQRKEQGEGMVKEVGIDIYSLLYLKWIIDEDLLYV